MTLPHRLRSTAPHCRPHLEVLEDRTAPSINPPFDIAATGAFEAEPATASQPGDTARSSIVAWTQRASGSQDPGNIMAQLHDKEGNPFGPVIPVANTGDDEFFPDVAMDVLGGFVVVWTRNVSNGGNFDLHFARYTSDGDLINSGAVANSTSLDQGFGQVAMRATGEFVVSYTRVENPDQPGADADLLAIRFHALGFALGTIKIAARPDRQETFSRIDMADGGKFAVSYLQSRGTLAAGGARELFVRRFAASGKGLGTPVRLLRTDGPVPAHDVGIDNQGNVAVVYDRGGNVTPNTITLRRVLKTGAVGAAVRLTDTDEDEAAPRIAVDRSDGDFVVNLTRRRVTPIPGTDVVVGEFSKTGAFKHEHVLGGPPNNTSSSAVSIDGLDGFFVAYLDVFGPIGPPQFNIKGAFGTLV